jgi:hypothetical protein
MCVSCDREAEIRRQRQQMVNADLIPDSAHIWYAYKTTGSYKISPERVTKNLFPPLPSQTHTKFHLLVLTPKCNKTTTENCCISACDDVYSRGSSEQSS